jgi:general secretion pathway protein G
MVVKIIVSGRMKWTKKELQSGFIVLEVIIVLFLIGIILTLASPHFSSATNQVQNRIDQANKARIEGAAQLYRIDVGAYPQSVSDLLHPPMGESGWCGPYLNQVPLNPFDSSQIYQIDAFGRVKKVFRE